MLIQNTYIFIAFLNQVISIKSAKSFNKNITNLLIELNVLFSGEDCSTVGFDCFHNVEAEDGFVVGLRATTKLTNQNKLK